MSDRQPTPIDKRAENASIYQMWKDGIHPFLIKIEELCICHFSGSHDEFAMIASGHMPPNGNIEGLIRENDAGYISVHEASDDSRIGGITADERMGS